MNEAEVLEAAAGVLDEVTAATAFLVVADDPLAAAPAGDDGNGAGVAERAPQLVGALVARHIARSGYPRIILAGQSSRVLFLPYQCGASASGDNELFFPA